MDKLILKDSTEIEVEQGASIRGMTVYLESYEALSGLAAKLNVDNLSSVRIISDPVGGSSYTNMALREPNFTVTAKDNAIKADFGLRKLTETEIKEPFTKQAAAMLTDEQAVQVKALYDEYAYGVLYLAGDRKRYSDVLYRCLQEHTSQEGWEPGTAPSLWVSLEDDTHAGTLEDPIPVPDTVTTAGMEYEYGKYYVEDGAVYLCKQFGIEDTESTYGQKITLYYPPSGLVGQHFEAVEG